MKIYAHRGFSGEYPENTMLAFRKANEENCDGIEMDVQLTKDLVPVIIHDEKIDRTSNGSGYICEMTYDELKKYDFSYPDKFGGKFGFQEIPTLDEFLKWMAEEAVTLVTNIELKNSVYYYGGMEKIVLDKIAKYGLEDRIIISSFNNASVVLCKQMNPNVECGFLIEKCIGNPGVYARTCGVEYYHPNLAMLTEEHVKNCSQNGIGINVWTVNEEEDLRRMRQWGVRTAITNYPDRGCRIVRE